MESTTRGTQHIGQNTKNMIPALVHVKQLGYVLIRVVVSRRQCGHADIIIGLRLKNCSLFLLKYGSVALFGI